MKKIKLWLNLAISPGNESVWCCCFAWIVRVIAWKGSKPTVFDDFRLFQFGFVKQKAVIPLFEMKCFDVIQQLVVKPLSFVWHSLVFFKLKNVKRFKKWWNVILQCRRKVWESFSRLWKTPMNDVVFKQSKKVISTSTSQHKQKFKWISSQQKKLIVFSKLCFD